MTFHQDFRCWLAEKLLYWALRIVPSGTAEKDALARCLIDYFSDVERRLAASREGR